MNASQKHFTTIKNRTDFSPGNQKFMDALADLRHALSVQNADPLSTVQNFMRNGFKEMPESMHGVLTSAAFSIVASHPSASAFEWLCSQPDLVERLELEGDDNVVLRKMTAKYLEPKTSEQCREEILFMWEEAMVKLDVDAFMDTARYGVPINESSSMYMATALKKFNKSLPDFLKEQGAPVFCEIEIKLPEKEQRVSVVASLNHIWQLEQVIEYGYDIVGDEKALDDLKKYMKNVAYEAFFNTPIVKETLAYDAPLNLVDHEVSFHMSLRLIENLMRERGLDFKQWMTELAFDPVDPVHKNLGMDLLQEFVLENYKDLTPYSFIFKDTPKQMTIKEAAEESTKGAANYFTRDLAKQWQLMETVKQTDPKLDHHQVEFRF